MTTFRLDRDVGLHFGGRCHANVIQIPKARHELPGEVVIAQQGHLIVLVVVGVMSTKQEIVLLHNTP